MTEVERICLISKNVAPVVAGLSSQQKNDVLFSMADYLRKYSAEILAGNESDVRKARENGTSESIIDRLILNEKRIADMADAIEQIAEYDDPVGRVLDVTDRPNGMKIDIIASGGVSTLDDVKALRKLNLHGAIIGKAYYTKKISIKEAIEVAK